MPGLDEDRRVPVAVQSHDVFAIYLIEEAILRAQVIDLIVVMVVCIVPTSVMVFVRHGWLQVV